MVRKSQEKLKKNNISQEKWGVLKKSQEKSGNLIKFKRKSDLSVLIYKFLYFPKPSNDKN